MKFFIFEHGPWDTDYDMEFHFSDKFKRLDASPPYCPVCNGPIGLRVSIPPFYIDLECHGTAYSDFAFYLGAVLASERVVKSWQASGLTGFTGFTDVEIVKVRGRSKLKEPKPIPRYYYSTVTRSRAAVDTVASGFREKPGQRCPECRGGQITDSLERIILEPGTWSGEDIFVARGWTGSIMTTERFKDWVEKNQFTNCSFVPAEDYSFDFFDLSGFKRLN